MERYNFLSKHMIVAYYDPETSPLKRETLQFGLYDAYSPRVQLAPLGGGGHRVVPLERVLRRFAIDSPQGAVQVRGVRDSQTSASA